MCVQGTVAMLMLLLTGPTSGGATTMPGGWIHDVHTFIYLTQNLQKDDTFKKLANSSYDLLIIDSLANQHGGEQADMKSIVDNLRSARGGRHVLCYLDIAEAEEYRTYWDKAWFGGWKGASKGARGKPDFILEPDPDGWAGNFPVAFWDPRWKAIMLGANGIVRKLMNEGYDGLLLDWAVAYRDPGVMAEAQRQGVDATKAMIDLLAAVRDDARAVNPAAVIVPMNVPELIDDDPRVLALIDAVVFEGTWFNGKADAEWNDPAGGDRPASDTAKRLLQYKKYQSKGKPVLTIDYCLDVGHARQVYRDARQLGFVPLVTRVGVEHLTGTPPP